MLMVKEFEQVACLRNSDGEAITESSVPYAAIYDSSKTSGKIVDESIQRMQTNNDVIILPLGVWEQLHDMITDNYTLTPKS